MSNPNEVSRVDPFGEFEHIKPVTVLTAAQLLRVATNNQVATDKEWALARLELAKLEKAKETADTVHKEAMHRLHISALQPNGGH